MSSFIHLHLHDEFSMLDGAGRIPAYVKQGKDFGMWAMAQTNHGNIAGSYEFYMECMKQGIEPLLGCEFYFVRDAEAVKEDKDAERFHVVFIARNEKGFHILSELSTASHRKFYYKPLLDRKMIEAIPKKDRKHLVVLSGCAGSILSRMVLKAIPGDPDEELNWWRKQFPHFFMELQHHDCDFDRKLNRRLLKLGKRHELPWVITNDPHYVMPEEDCHHDALLAIQTASDLDDPNRFRFDGSGYHLRSRSEIRTAFRQYGKEVWLPGIKATETIARNCKIRISDWEKRTWHIPKFPDADDSTGYLKKLARRGLRARGLLDRPEYVARLNHELKEFRNVSMEDFLLITADTTSEARNRGIRVGPGRGSVCGTLVGYGIGIHKIDPIKYDLLFERFLNPERPKMPDVDTDFQASRRNEMIDYSIQKYGQENTMRVGAYQTMQVRKTFKSLAHSMGIPFQAANEISKKIEEDEEGNAILPAEITEGYPDLAAHLEALKGLKAGVSRHAAGVIIFAPDDPMKRLVPEMWIPSSKEFVCQWDKDAVSDMGLLKNDFLGLRTLDTIEECVKLIKLRHGVDIEPDDWVPDV